MSIRYIKQFVLLTITFIWSVSSFAQTSNTLSIGFRDSIVSKQLSETRYLNIYLPEGYSDTQKYNVIYLLDGGMDEDFIHVVGLVWFNSIRCLG